MTVMVHRIDQINFHPAYHELMRIAIENGLHSSPWQSPGAGAHVARAAKYYLHTQVEAAHGCPINYDVCRYSSPATSNLICWQPMARRSSPKTYDPRNVPDGQKQGLTIGMAMTEKQGGSDVRSNSTRAYPVGQRGPGQAYELVGHKWFCVGSDVRRFPRARPN